MEVWKKSSYCKLLIPKMFDIEAYQPIYKLDIVTLPNKSRKSDNLKAVEYTTLSMPLYLMMNNLATVFTVLPGMIKLTFFGFSGKETFILKVLQER